MTTVPPGVACAVTSPVRFPRSGTRPANVTRPSPPPPVAPARTVTGPAPPPRARPPRRSRRARPASRRSRRPAPCRTPSPTSPLFAPSPVATQLGSPPPPALAPDALPLLRCPGDRHPRLALKGQYLSSATERELVAQCRSPDFDSKVRGPRGKRPGHDRAAA